MVRAGIFLAVAATLIACSPASAPLPAATATPATEILTQPPAPGPAPLRTSLPGATVSPSKPAPAPEPTMVITARPTPSPIPTSKPAPTVATTGPAQPGEVTFDSGNLKLRGFIYRPAGAGPFPAVLWNHGSERLPGWLPGLGELFTRQGYVFFIPHRRGQGRSADQGEYIMDLLEKEYRERGPDARSKLLVTLHERDHLNDQMAGLSYLKGIPYVDARRMAVAGISFGGIQTLLAVEAGSEQNLGIRTAVSFAAAAQTWKTSPHLRDRLVAAVRKASVPVFFIQAENDYDLTPGRTLAAEMARLGKPGKLKIFPAFGATAQDGHVFGARGGEIWGPEVFPFLNERLKQ